MSSSSITVEQMVQREVMCCMSSIVSTLAQGYGRDHASADNADLAYQAYELTLSVSDYEEAANIARFTRTGDGQCIDLRNELYANAQEACEANGVEPYGWEVFEHWAVTPWLAEQLIAEGERVDTDFGGLCVWARTYTGRAIDCDGAMQRIHAALMGGEALSHVS